MVRSMILVVSCVCKNEASVFAKGIRIQTVRNQKRERSGKDLQIASFCVLIFTKRRKLSDYKVATSDKFLHLSSL
jgi:hypothetical protein